MKENITKSKRSGQKGSTGFYVFSLYAIEPDFTPNTLCSTMPWATLMHRNNYAWLKPLKHQKLQQNPMQNLGKDSWRDTWG